MPELLIEKAACHHCYVRVCRGRLHTRTFSEINERITCGRVGDTGVGTFCFRTRGALQPTKQATDFEKHYKLTSTLKPTW